MPDTHECAFCGRTEASDSLVEGPGVRICVTCIWLCVAVLEARGFRRPAVVSKSAEESTDRCSVCDQVVRVTVFDDRRVCSTCASVLAQAFLRGPQEMVESVWGQTLSQELLVRRVQWCTVGSESEAQVHSDLAVAYSEMGLLPDAIMEAALAIVASRNPFDVREALRVLLSVPKTEALRALRNAPCS